MDKDFKIPAWMLEVDEDPAPKKTKPKAQQSKPQGQRKYKTQVGNYLKKVDKAGGY